MPLKFGQFKIFDRQVHISTFLLLLLFVGDDDLLDCVTTESKSFEIFNPVGIKSLINPRQIVTPCLTKVLLEFYESLTTVLQVLLPSYKSFHSLTSLFHKKVLRARSALAILSSEISF